MAKLKPSEVVDGLKIVVNILKGLTEEDAIGGVILTEDAYIPVLRLFGPSAEVYRPSAIEFDPNKETAFVVDGILFLRGTQAQ